MPKRDQNQSPPLATAVEPLTADLQTGQRIGPYSIVKELGRGGMGAVFLASDSRSGREVALKIVLPAYAGDTVALERLLREGRAASSITNDHVVPVLDVGQHDEIVYVAMPVLLGRTLDALLKSAGQLPILDIARIGAETALGLGAAHAKGFIHRDIKPGNIWLEEAGGRVKILDFGLARNEAEASPLTATDAVLGTPHYMAPEQARGSTINEQTDLFSLGVVLYRMATGKLPFNGKTTAAVLTAVAIDSPEPVAKLRPDAPPRLIGLINALLTKDRLKRPRTADVVVSELRLVERGIPISAEQPGLQSDSEELGSTGAFETDTPWSFSKTEIKNRKKSKPISRKRLAIVAMGLLFCIVAAIGSWKGVAAFRDSARARELRAFHDQSEVACREGRYDVALALANQAIERNGNHALGYARRARAKYFLGDEEGTLVDCDEAIRRDPNLGIALAYRAMVAHLHEHPSVGIQNGERAVEAMPDSSELLACLALAFLEAGDSKAELTALRAIEMQPNDAEAHRVRGLTLAARGDPSARDSFDLAVKLSGELPFYTAARANYLVQFATTLSGEKETSALAQAEADANHAVSSAPNLASGHLALAQVYSAQGRRDAMLIAVDRAIAIEPRMVGAYLRGAENLSPRALRRFQMLQDAVGQPLNLADLKLGGDFAFHALLVAVQRLVSETMKQDVTTQIIYDTFPEEKRAILGDTKINILSLMDVSGERLLSGVSFGTILEILCQHVGAKYWVSSEHIEIVSIDAHGSSSPQQRILASKLSFPRSLAKWEQRRQKIDQVMQQTLDAGLLKNSTGQFRCGELLVSLQSIASQKTKFQVPIRFDYNSFPVERRNTLLGSAVDLYGLLDTSSKFPSSLGLALKNIGKQLNAQVLTTPDFIEFVSDEEVFRRSQFGQKKGVEPGLLLARMPRGQPRPESLPRLGLGLQSVPESARLYLARGEIYLEQYELDKAIDDFNRAIERNPGYARAYGLRSIALAARGRQADETRSRADALASGR